MVDEASGSAVLFLAPAIRRWAFFLALPAAPPTARTGGQWMASALDLGAPVDGVGAATLSAFLRGLVNQKRRAWVSGSKARRKPSRVRDIEQAPRHQARTAAEKV